MDGCNGGGSGVNSFALVSYLPEPLAGFLDQLRVDLVRECRAKAHVTVLPPRPLLCPAEEAWRELHQSLQDCPPFRVELGAIEVFPITDVIYLSVEQGHKELEQLHRRLNTGCVAFHEPFNFHPHVTLAQELDPGSVASAREWAARRWNEFSHPRSFRVDRLMFVQNTLENRWTDLHGFPLVSRVAT